jgi:YD repeat-containing protein
MESCPPSSDCNVTTLTSYTPDGNVATITAVNSATGNQITQYIYGTTLTNSAVATSNLKSAEIYPDSVDGSDQITFRYDRQNELIQTQDQNGTVHVYDRDKLGRPIEDRVTLLGYGVDA